MYGARNKKTPRGARGNNLSDVPKVIVCTEVYVTLTSRIFKSEIKNPPLICDGLSLLTHGAEDGI